MRERKKEEYLPSKMISIMHGQMLATTATAVTNVSSGDDVLVKKKKKLSGEEEEDLEKEDEILLVQSLLLLLLMARYRDGIPKRASSFLQTQCRVLEVPSVLFNLCSKSVKDEEV